MATMSVRKIAKILQIFFIYYWFNYCVFFVYIYWYTGINLCFKLLFLRTH